MSFIQPNFILRDTSGFERLLEEQVRNERLEEDAKKAIASLNEPDVYLLCVSAEPPGNKYDLALYDEYLRSQYCVHVMPHAEDFPDKSLIELRNNFYQDFHLLPNELNSKPLVCTGISNRGRK